MLFQKNLKYPREWKEQARAIKEAFHWRCALCRQKCSSPDQPTLTVHHIDDDWENNNAENLLPLCFACHLSVDREMIEYFAGKDQQLELFPDYDYLTAMNRLWKTGWQNDSPEQESFLPGDSSSPTHLKRRHTA